MTLSFIILDVIIIFAAAFAGFLCGAFMMDNHHESLNGEMWTSYIDQEIEIERLKDGIADRDKAIQILNQRIEDRTWTRDKVQEKIKDVWRDLDDGTEY